MTKTLLQKALEVEDLLSDEARWSKGTPARDANNRDVMPLSPHACKFCLIGAIAYVDGVPNAYSNIDAHGSELARAFIEAVDGYTGRLSWRWRTSRMDADELYGFNDRQTTTHEDIMTVCGAVVAAAQVLEAA